jgi:hypothetical protein
MDKLPKYHDVFLLLLAGLTSLLVLSAIIN